MKAKPLRLVGNFDASSQDTLERQLTQFEQNTDDAIRSVAGVTLPTLIPTNKKTANYTAALDELVLVDTSAASRTITIPVATPQNAGRLIAIARLSASNTLTVRAVSGNVNGSTSLALSAAIRLFFLASDGSAWWSTA